MIRGIPSLVLLMVSMPAFAHALPISTIEHGAVPARESIERDDVCHLRYYNTCSGWVWLLSGYCYGNFGDAPTPPMYGTCFDLADCPDQCRHLDDIWWACKCFTSRGVVNVEVFCADEHCCPVGPPILGFYEIVPGCGTPWQHFPCGGIPLCICEEQAAGKFIVMITDLEYGVETAPYVDLNSYNLGAGCETEWRCQGHSYCYRNVVDYCAVYGAPGAVWWSGPTYGCTNYPSVPPGCHNYFYDHGFHLEWLIDVYISCQGPTETEQSSWSQVKRLYR